MSPDHQQRRVQVHTPLSLAAFTRLRQSRCDTDDSGAESVSKECRNKAPRHRSCSNQATVSAGHNSSHVLNTGRRRSSHVLSTCRPPGVAAPNRQDRQGWRADMMLWPTLGSRCDTGRKKPEVTEIHGIQYMSVSNFSLPHDY